MANPFYIYSGAFIPGTLAKAEQSQVEFQSVQSGFALLAVQGTDAGTANTYVVTTNSLRTTYVDGYVVEFKAKFANTGASTINVDSGGVVSLTNSAGQSLGSGAIAANTWYRALYNSTYSAWTLIAPSSLTTTSATVSTGAPTNKVGLTAAGGVATSVLPSDATWALDPSIVPTWTGAHVFSAAVTFNGTVTFSSNLALTGTANAYAETITGNSTVGQSLGLKINAGTNASDFALLINNQSAGTQFLAINGQGSVTVGTPTGGAKGVGTINAQNLYVQGAAVVTTAVTSANPTASVALAAVNGTAATFMTSDSAPALSQAIAPTWTAAHVFTPSAAVAITVNVAVNKSGIVVTGGTNTALNYLLNMTTGQGSGFSGGIRVLAGTTSADSALNIADSTGANQFMVLRGDGAFVIGNPANIVASFGNLSIGGILGPKIRLQDSGAKGVILDLAATNTAININSNFVTGPVQVINLQSNSTTILQIGNTTAPTLQGYGPVAAALVDMTPDKGTFTITGTGFTVNPTATATWVRNGNQVTISIPFLTGTSNATTFTLTGIPAAIQSATLTSTTIVIVRDNGVGGIAGSVTITAGSGTWTLKAADGAAFTGSGTKSLGETTGSLGSCFSYPIV